MNRTAGLLSTMFALALASCIVAPPPPAPTPTAPTPTAPPPAPTTPPAQPDETATPAPTPDTTDTSPADCPDASDARVSYTFHDPKQCQAALIRCSEGKTLFFDACGCGCIERVGECSLDSDPGKTSCDDKVCPAPGKPGVRYMSRRYKKCRAIRFVCEAGESMFSDECGCGCIAR